MIVTANTRETLRCRRVRRQLARDGWQEVTERGGMLWKLHRGLGWTDHVISDVMIAPEGKTLFVKISKKEK